jgi:hypothetical protein
MVLKPPQSLVQHLRESRCVLFAGSGLSAWAGLPTWERLLSALVEEMRAEQISVEDVDEMDRLIAAGKLLEVAEHCKAQLGNRYVNVLSARLGADDGDLPEPHQIIVRLPFSGVVTTNYDNLIETAYQKLTNVSLKAPTHEDTDVLGTLLFDGNFFVLKAHGNLDRPSTLVLTSSDYRDILHSNAAFSAFFSSILMSKAVLFIGYSLNDPDFRLLLDRHLSTFQRWVPERYALMPDVGAVESKVMWESMRIRVLSYPVEDGRHDAVLDFLHELERLVRGDDSTAPVGEWDTPREVKTVATSSWKSSRGVELSLRVEEGRLTAALTFGWGSVQAGRGPLPDPLKLSRLQNSVLSSFDAVLPVATALSESVAPSVLEKLSEEAPPGEPIFLVAQPEVEALPWEWLLVGDEHLMLRNPVVRIPPSISEGYAVIGTPPRFLLIGDPTNDSAPALPGAREEVQLIAELCRTEGEVVTLVGEDATIAAVIEWLRRGELDVIHFAGHAWFDAAEHYLQLADGQLRATELRSLLSAQPPALVFLNSHYTAFVPPFARVREQEEAAEEISSAGQLRLMDCALAAGCGSFVGCLSSPSDSGARDIATSFYRLLTAGNSVAEALHRALLDQRTRTQLDALTYVIAGAADLVGLQRVSSQGGLGSTASPLRWRSGGALTCADCA